MEAIQGVIPEVWASFLMDPREGCVMLTEHRLIFILDRARSNMNAGMFGFTPSRSVKKPDLKDGDIDALAHDKNNIEIPYDRIELIRIRRGFSLITMNLEFFMLVDYNDASGNAARIKFILIAPIDMLKQKEGRIGRKAAILKHLEFVRNALENVLPESLVRKIEFPSLTS